MPRMTSNCILTPLNLIRPLARQLPSCGRSLLRGLRASLGHVPLTILGWIALPVLGWLLWTYGFGRNDRILFAIGLTGLALVGLAVFQVCLATAWLRFRRQPPLASVETEAGVPTRTGFRLGWIGWNPLLAIDVEWTIPGMAARWVPTAGGLEEEITASERLLQSQVIRRFHVSDVLGLSRLGCARPMELSVTIQPSCGQVKEVRLLQQQVTGEQIAHHLGKPEGDLIETRRYVPGDPLKLVLWKVYARTGQMLVRGPERALSPSPKTLAYLVAAPQDEASAGSARAMLETGSLGSDFLFAADGAESPTTSAGTAVDQIVRSANARDWSGRGLSAFLAQGAQAGVQACLVFLPCRPGEWLARVAGACARHPTPCRAVIGIDGIEPPPDRSLRRWLLRGEPGGGASTRDLEAICGQLQAAGVEVVVIDRDTGRTYLPAELLS